MQRQEVGAGSAPIGSFSRQPCVSGAAPLFDCPVAQLLHSPSLPGAGQGSACVPPLKSSSSSLSVLGINNPNFPALTKR